MLVKFGEVYRFELEQLLLDESVELFGGGLKRELLEDVS